MGSVEDQNMRRFGYNIARTKSIFTLLEQQAPNEYAFTLDGNEQFLDANQFRLHWNELTNNLPDSFLDHLLFVEQPFHRDIALSEHWRSVEGLEGCPPIIIDESDGDLDSLPTAIALGYEDESQEL